MLNRIMKEKETIRRLRIGTIFIGVGLMIFSVLMDVIGISQPGDFGMGQILIAGLGACILIIAMLGKRILQMYQIAGMILLTIVILFILSELLAVGLNRLSEWQRAQESRAVAFEQEEFTESDWGSIYWKDFAALERQYTPFTIWRSQAFDGQTIKISTAGLRQTPGAACESEDAYTVFIFGGSTMWGAGSPDWFTIPAYLQSMLDEIHDEPVCVINFGQSAYVMTQEVIELMSQLQQGNIPDVVVFYDGDTDTLSTFSNRTAFSHLQFGGIADKFNRRDSNTNPDADFLNWLRATNTGQLIDSVLPSTAQASPDRSEPEEPPPSTGKGNQPRQDVIQLYLTNVKMVQAIAEQFEFEAYFFWQPVIFVGDKPFTDSEASVLRGGSESLPAFYQDIYARIEMIADDIPQVYYLGNLFDDVTDNVYIDYVSHLYPKGNELVATAILNVIVDSESN